MTTRPFRFPFLDLPSELRARIYYFLIFEAAEYTTPQGRWITQATSPFTFSQMLSTYFSMAMLLVNRQIRDEYAFQICMTKHEESPVDSTVVGFVSHREIEFYFEENHHHDLVLHAGKGKREVRFFFNIVCPTYYPHSPIFLKYTRSVVMKMVVNCAPPEDLFENDDFNVAEYDPLAATEIRRLRFSSHLASFLQKSFEKLQFVRFNLRLGGQRFTFSWLRGELERLRAAVNLSDTELLVSVVMELSRNQIAKFHLLAKADLGSVGWRHVGQTTGVNKCHDTGINEHHRVFHYNCFRCWIDQRAAGAQSLRLPQHWEFNLLGLSAHQTQWHFMRIQWE